MEYINLKAQYCRLKDGIDNRINEVVKNTAFIGGKYVNELEEKLAGYVGRKYCITCGNGTDALLLAYMAYGVGAGDAIFCPDMTFIASIEPACLLGAMPVFCDIDAETFNIAPESLERQILRIKDEGKLKPKAVVIVDFLGNPADYDKLLPICKKYNLTVIEDFAQGMGASYKGKKCGSYGDISTTSFFPSKPLGCYGDGGAVFTDDYDVAELIQSYKVHGKGPNGKYDNIRIGVNSRLDNLQAGVLLEKFTVLDEEIEQRQLIANEYDRLLSDTVVIPKVTEGGISAYAQYCIQTSGEKERQELMLALKEKNIPSLIYYPNPLSSMKAFEGTDNEIQVNTKKYADCNLGLPFSPYLMAEEQKQVVDVILENIRG